MGGLGKTQLSLNYARQSGDRYTSVFWVNAKDELSLRQSFSSLCSIISPGNADDSSSGSEKAIDSVRRWLSEEFNTRWLMLFDNYDDPNLPNIKSTTGFDIRSYFPYRAQGHILITTRSPKLVFSKRLMLQRFDDVDSSLAILSQRAGRDLNTETDARKLAIRLDGLPLALATAGVYLGQTNVSCTEYLQEYESAWSDLHGPDSEELFEYAERTLSSTWVISFEQVRRVDADATELLKFWVYFSNKDVWYELICNGASEGPAWMGRLAGSKIRFDRAMTRLRDYSLAESTSGSYSIHTCVHTWISEHFTIEQAAFDAAATCLAKSITDLPSPEYWPRTRRLLLHLKRLGDERFRALWDQSRTTEMLSNSFNIGSVLHDWRHLDEAQVMYERTLKGYEITLGHHHRLTLDTVNNLGMLFADKNSFSEAQEMYQRALRGYEETLRPGHPATLSTLNNFGVVYYREGRFEEAKEFLQRALREQDIELGSSHMSTLCTMNNLGVLYRAQGDLAEAERVNGLVVTELEKLNGHDHPITLQVIHNIGLMKVDQGKLEEAEELFLQALMGYEKVLGTDHALALDTVYDLGKLYHSQGKLDKADAHLSRVISSAEDEGTIQPRTAKCIRGLAAVLSMSTKTNDPPAARKSLARLIRLAEGDGWKREPGFMYYLSRAFWWIGDQDNAIFAFSQDASAQCNGCDGPCPTNEGRYVCYQCDEVDLCSDCEDKYKNQNLNIQHSSCEGHNHFDVSSAIPESLRSRGQIGEAEMDEWIRKLKDVYVMIPS